MYETRVLGSADMSLVSAFGALGYASYRLVPGLDLLVPFDGGAPHDEYLLNLFCCKPDRAAKLARDGFLVERPLDARQFRKEKGQWFGRAQRMEKYTWRQTLAKLPYGKALAAHWTATVKAGRSKEVEEALCLRALAHDTALLPAERYAGLQASVSLLADICAEQPAYLRRLSLARAALELGARKLGVQCLRQVSQEILDQRRPDPSEPFLAPSLHHDTLPPGNAIAQWICAAALEELERNRSFSSYYTGATSLQPLENVRQLGFASAQTLRCLDLIRQRFRLEQDRRA